MRELLKNKNQNTFLLSLIFFVFFGTGLVFSQTDSKQLAKTIKDYISNYYTEDINVAANDDGIVTLTGQVNTLFDKLRIGELIASLDGVKGLKNNIEIINELTADNVIKANIENELKMNDAISEPEKINVDVKNDVVTLSGTVNYYREKLIAQSIASWQDGVSDIVSNIVVLQPSVARSDDNLKIIIYDILHRQFPLEKNIWFEVDGGNVTLDGTVKSLYAKDSIPKEIQRVIGVKNVENNLTVENNY